MFIIISQRSDWLPAFDDEGLRLVASEMEELSSRLKGILDEFDANNLPPNVKLTFLYYRSCLSRNNRYLDRYVCSWLNSCICLVPITYQRCDAVVRQLFPQQITQTT